MQQQQQYGSQSPLKRRMKYQVCAVFYLLCRRSWRGPAWIDTPQNRQRDHPRPSFPETIHEDEVKPPQSYETPRAGFVHLHADGVVVVAKPYYDDPVLLVEDGLVDGPARPQVGEEVAHCFFAAAACGADRPAPGRGAT